MYLILFSIHKSSQIKAQLTRNQEHEDYSLNSLNVNKEVGVATTLKISRSKYICISYALNLHDR